MTSLRRLAPALALCAACAAGGPAGPAGPAGAPAADALAAGSADELWTLGAAAEQAGDPARAEAAFDALARRFPTSPRAPAALLRAGLAARAQGAFDRALPRFEARAGGPPGAEADDARFLAAEALDRLDRRAEARAVLDALAARGDLDAARHVRALVERGVVELELGDPDAAERSLQAGLDAWGAAAGRERLPAEVAARARFWLGEAARVRFAQAPVDPRAPADEVGRQLERKAQLLLAAQARYLDVMRAGDPTYGVAAGARVGELYESLRDELLAAPVPASLGEEDARAYRDELRRQLRALVVKAVEAYQETLAAARHAGVDNDFVARMEEGLARMQRIAAEEDAAAAPGG